ncbi:RNA-binding domain-containing protein [uncultured Duncaniella sp.]|uniref:RNA-binding domain-containing protein n=1 Tax=uncultured Duncaniella sp. TaxID=2768039 RepID=UPI0025B63670|nr:RNA-binding domain-containing protein [uncultured Duncaniella sp.]
MTEKELANLLDELIAKCNRETRHLEFKSNYQDANTLGEYISALSNGATLDNEEYGYLFFGVNDETLDIVGTTFEPAAQKVSFKLDKSSKASNQYLEMGLRQYVAPKINFQIESFTANNGKRVVVFIIPAAKEEPTYFMGKAYVRVDSCKTDLKNYPAWVRQIYNSHKDWSAEIVETASLEDLDPEAIAQALEGYCQRFPHKAVDAREKWSVQEFLDHAKITINGKITRAALLLLGKEESAHHLNHVAQIVWRLDTGEERAATIFHPPFLLSAINVRKAIRNYQFKIFPNNALLPAEVWKYDNRSILEALHNCIMHQDYAMNERIIVNEYVDKLVFTNVGSFYDGAYEDYVEGKKTPGRYRNQFLCNAMVNLKMVDSQGFGIHDMYQHQRDRFLPMPDYDRSNESHVILEIPGQVINREYSETLMENGSLDLLTVVLLDRVQKGKPLTKDAVKKLRIQKLIEGRSPNVIISRKVAGITHQEAEYTDLSGFDDQWYRDLIIKALKDHGKLRRADFDKLLIPKLPGILSESQKKSKVGNLLTSLRVEGKIYVGENRYWYLTE